MNFDYFSDKIVFGALKHIKHGRINLINYDKKKYTFGYKNDSLNVNIKINSPGLMKNIIRKGSVGLAESYINGDFETNNLQDLICLLYTSPSPRDVEESRMPSSA